MNIYSPFFSVLAIQRNGYKKRYDIFGWKICAEYVGEHLRVSFKVQFWRPDMREENGIGTVCSFDKTKFTVDLYCEHTKTIKGFHFKDIEILNEI